MIKIDQIEWIAVQSDKFADAVEQGVVSNSEAADKWKGLTAEALEAFSQGSIPWRTVDKFLAEKYPVTFWAESGGYVDAGQSVPFRELAAAIRKAQDLI